MGLLSYHARNAHQSEKWTPEKIYELYKKEGWRFTLLKGETADVYHGDAPDGTHVGLILGKNGVVITGFPAPKEYWESV